MDALALLCTLHADGPTTLRRLRQVGCSTIQSVEKLPLEQLAEILAGSPAAARRFCREARALQERCAVGWLEHEELSATTAPAAQHFTAEVHAAAPARTSPASLASFGAQESDLAIGEREILDRVLRVWRERDAHEPTPAAIPSNHAVATVVVPEQVPAIAACARSSGDDLFPSAVDGLSDDILHALRASGVSTLAALAGCDALEMARASGLGYTRIARLRALAERARSESSCAPEGLARRESTTFGAPRNGDGKVSLADGPQPGRTEALYPDWSGEITPHAPHALRTPARGDDSESAGGPFV
ncbi:MAG: hypothetical protein ACKVWV_14290 [Planctomycetota bacterium]